MSKKPTYISPSEGSTMLALLGKTAVVCIIPKAVDAVYDAFFKTTPDAEELVEPERTYSTSEVKALLATQKEMLVLEEEETVVDSKKLHTASPKNSMLGNGIYTNGAKDASRFITDAEKPVKAKRKIKDTSPFTKEQYDFICQAYEGWLSFNKSKKGEDRILNEELIKDLNRVLGKHKSQGPYCNIYMKYVSRDSLISSNEPYILDDVPGYFFIPEEKEDKPEPLFKNL